MKTVLVFLVSSLGFAFSNTDCYLITTSNISERDSRVSEVQSKWCYADTDIDGKKALFIFNVDTDPVREELSVLMLPDGGIVHGSLLKGNVSSFSSPTVQVNPIPAPLKRPSVGGPHIRMLKVIPSFETMLSAKDALSTLTRKPIEILDNKLEAGISESYLPDESLPYAGYWWPYANAELATNEGSPIAKYDAYVKAQTGVDPQARAWEIANHSESVVAWGGHCNGWAASALLHKEIEVPRWDPGAKQVLYNSDINGMFAEASFCVDSASYGVRNYGRETDDPYDIYPDKFHKVLTYYIEGLKKPVAMDYEPDLSIDNAVVTGYHMEIVADPAEPLTFTVKTKLRRHHYEMAREEGLGVAQAQLPVYEYILRTDAEGNILSGEWLSENPDFMWVPLSQKKCGRENPNMDHTIIQQMVDNLAPATVQEVQINWQSNKALAPEENLKVPTSLPTGYEFEFVHSPVADGDRLSLLIDGNFIYGTPVTDYEIPIFPGHTSTKTRLIDIKNVRVRNAGKLESATSDFSISKVKWLGGS